MPRTRNPYPAEFREQMVALVRTGRSVESLAREYEPCAVSYSPMIGQDLARFKLLFAPADPLPGR